MMKAGSQRHFQKHGPSLNIAVLIGRQFDERMRRRGKNLKKRCATLSAYGGEARPRHSAARPSPSRHAPHLLGPLSTASGGRACQHYGDRSTAFQTLRGLHFKFVYCHHGDNKQQNMRVSATARVCTSMPRRRLAKG